MSHDAWWSMRNPRVKFYGIKLSTGERPSWQSVLAQYVLLKNVVAKCPGTKCLHMWRYVHFNFYTMFNVHMANRHGQKLEISFLIAEYVCLTDVMTVNNGLLDVLTVNKTP